MRRDQVAGAGVEERAGESRELAASSPVAVLQAESTTQSASMFSAVTSDAARYIGRIRGEIFLVGFELGCWRC